MAQYRAVIDADVTFRNEGGIQVQGFRLDLPGPDVTEDQVAGLLVSHLGLLMVDRVRVHALRVVAEPHRGTRYGVPAGAEPVAGGGSRRLVELNHPIVAGMTTYPGLPGPEITPHLTRADSRAHYAPGTEFAIDRISLVGNTGTYLDSPFHRYPDGADLAALPLESVADLPVVVVRLADPGAAPPDPEAGPAGGRTVPAIPGGQAGRRAGSGRRAIDAHAVRALDVAGRAVLLHTGWDRHWGTPEYGAPAPYLTGEAARYLAHAGAALVGIDSVNIDDAADTRRPAHSVLLAAGIPVLEHLTNLGALPVTGALLHAAPPRISDFGTFPVRAYAAVPADHPGGPPER